MRNQKKTGDKGRGRERHRNSSKKQGRRFFLVWLPIIIAAVLFLYVLVMDPSRPVGQPISGTTRDSERAQFGESDRNAYIVVLDDGRSVAIDGSLMGPLKAGRRVLVQENTTFIFKRKYYSFVRYLE